MNSQHVDYATIFSNPTTYAHENKTKTKIEFFLEKPASIPCFLRKPYFRPTAYYCYVRIPRISKKFLAYWVLLAQPFVLLFVYRPLILAHVGDFRGRFR